MGDTLSKPHSSAAVFFLALLFLRSFRKPTNNPPRKKFYFPLDKSNYSPLLCPMQEQEVKAKLSIKAINRAEVFREAGVDEAKGHRWLKGNATLDERQIRSLATALRRLHRAITF